MAWHYEERTLDPGSVREEIAASQAAARRLAARSVLSSVLADLAARANTPEEKEVCEFLHDGLSTPADGTPSCRKD